METVYVYFEKFSGAIPDDDIVDLILSSNGRVPDINWTDKTEKGQMDLIRGILKQVPLHQRDYDEKTFIWTFTGVAATRVVTILESGIKQGLFPKLEVKEIKNLKTKAEKRRLDAPDIEPNKQRDQVKFKEEDFFYTSSPSTQLSGEALHSKIATLLMISVEELKNADEQTLKKVYRKAALLYHPDRNNGDGSKMSDLNMYWNIFQGKA